MNADLVLDATIIFLGIVIEATPFVLLGVVLSAIIATFVKAETLIKFLPTNRLGSTLVASMFGFLFPVCECGNIPVARRLILKGVPPHVAITFLLAAPVFNPIVILATMAAFPEQPEMLWYRILFSVSIAIIVGLIFSAHRDPEKLLRKGFKQVKTVGHCHDHGGKTQQFFNTMIKEFFEMMAVLTVGALIASFVQIIIPRQLILSIGQNSTTSVLAMMLLAAIVSICSNVDAFFALSFTNTFTTGSILAFLVFGPMIDIKALIMLRSIFKVKTIFLISLFTAQLAFLATLFVNLNIS